MESWQARGKKVEGAEVVAQIDRYRVIYETLVEELKKSGSEIKTSYTIEYEKQSSRRYIWWAEREFIFPIQDVSLKTDDSIASGRDQKVDMTFVPHDPAAVRGHLLIEYDESEDIPIFLVTDKLRESALPDEALTAINQAFRGLETS